MFEFQPLQNYVLIEPFELSENCEVSKSNFFVPDDNEKNKSQFKVYKVSKISQFFDKRYYYDKGDIIVVYENMVNQINFNNQIYYIIPENGVVGKFK